MCGAQGQWQCTSGWGRQVAVIGGAGEGQAGARWGVQQRTGRAGCNGCLLKKWWGSLVRVDQSGQWRLGGGDGAQKQAGRELEIKGSK